MFFFCFLQPEIVSPPISGRTTLPPLQRVHGPSSIAAESSIDLQNNVLETQTQNCSPKYDNIHKPMIITSLDDYQNSNNTTEGKENSVNGSLNLPVENENATDKSTFETISLNTSEKLPSSEGLEEKVSS